MTSFNFKKWNTILGWSVFAIALITYSLTVEPSVSFWDCGEYIATSVKLEIGHPPGAPLFQMLGAFFAIFATNSSKIALMMNMMSVFSSAFTVLFLFWSLTLLMKNFLFKNENESSQKFTIINEIWDNEILVASSQSEKTAISGNAELELNNKIEVENPNLWSPQNPSLYILKTKLLSKGKEIDVEEFKIGIRKIAFIENEFYINGNKNKLPDEAKLQFSYLVQPKRNRFSKKVMINK